jgi:hypothetical protein
LTLREVLSHFLEAEEEAEEVHHPHLRKKVAVEEEVR